MSFQCRRFPGFRVPGIRGKLEDSSQERTGRIPGSEPSLAEPRLSSGSARQHSGPLKTVINLIRGGGLRAFKTSFKPHLGVQSKTSFKSELGSRGAEQNQFQAPFGGQSKTSFKLDFGQHCAPLKPVSRPLWGDGVKPVSNWIKGVRRGKLKPVSSPVLGAE